MKQTKILMGMPITVEILDPAARQGIFKKIFAYFQYVDKTFSTYKAQSEISKINRGEIEKKDFSQDMKTVFRLAEETKNQTHGYFNIITQQGKIDPSGLVKGWAIYQAAKILDTAGFNNYYIEAGGDVQARRKGDVESPWTVGIKNPFGQKQIVKILQIKTEGVATSGTYIRGQHIYNPRRPEKKILDAVSLTVVGPNVYEADRFATAAFAMGKAGINFIEATNGLEGYMINKDGIATQTSGFGKYVKK